MTDDAASQFYAGRELVGNVSLWNALGADLPDFDLIRDLIAQAYVAELGTSRRISRSSRHGCDVQSGRIRSSMDCVSSEKFFDMLCIQTSLASFGT